ncbi:uncharacterized protein C8R40DRAFT_875759 [Lentinula edodes]|uniref:uncharacterized protein n=1 Tax=Lentinula edodes TaxID=5353 RepID=UPI001E8E3C0C|nr:uncharacterized protein C8R40DRAFT_875759 [Lentinula edodes]KAH7877926.1 hypothetical protein C8R40DRAFT_875759 [Lentinula edodes]
MRFLTSLLPLITLALRVAATGPSPGSNSIPLTNINHQYPAPVHLYLNENGIYFPDEEAANPDAHRQRSPCRNCLEKAKDIIAAKIKAPVNSLKVVVGSSLGVITEHPVASLFIFVGCLALGSSALAIYCTVEYEKFEWCHQYLRAPEGIQRGILREHYIVVDSRVWMTRTRMNEGLAEGIGCKWCRTAEKDVVC